MMRGVNAGESNVIVSRAPLRANSANFCTAVLHYALPDVVEFRPTLRFRAFLLSFVVFGCVFCHKAPPLTAGGSDRTFAFAFTGIGALITLAGLLGLIAGSGSRRVTADRARDLLTIRSGLIGREKIFSLQDVAGVQVCSYGTSSAADSDDYIAYELNLVFKNHERTNVISHADHYRLRDDAVTFAAFLGVPLLDHAS